MSESNFRCKCGEPLFFSDNDMRHRIYTCLHCTNIYAVKGDDHYMILDEIDTKTGQIIPMEQTEKGKKYLLKESKRLKKLYGAKSKSNDKTQDAKDIINSGNFPW